jgi:hypothetical protein
MAGAPPTVGGSRERLVRWKHIVTAHMMVPAARPGAPRAALPAPAVQRIRAVSRKSVFSAWVFRRGGGAAAGFGALRRPHPHPGWQSVVAAPLSGPLPRIPGPLNKSCENNLPVKISLPLHTRGLYSYDLFTPWKVVRLHLGISFRLSSVSFPKFTTQ